MENFEILEKIGQGSYSTVLKVKRKEDNIIYALKKVNLSALKEKEKTNSLNEVRILASIHSPYVISYKEAFFDKNSSCLCIVMEYADNGDLYQKIISMKKKACLFEEKQIWKIFIQLIKGLKSLHNLKILHRDLKSANIFLFSDGFVKLGDLNVSKVTKKGLGYTQTGTPYYASPEVWKDHPYDNKSDIWSLGCVLYEMITLKPPFRAPNMDQLYKKVISGEYNKIPSNYSEDLSNIVDYLLQVNSNNRPSCDDLLHNKIIKKYMEIYDNENNLNVNLNDDILLKTIYFPKNLGTLENKLPKANYNGKHVKNCNSFSFLNKNNYNNNNNINKNNYFLNNNNNNNNYNNINTINNNNSNNNILSRNINENQLDYLYKKIEKKDIEYKKKFEKLENEIKNKNEQIKRNFELQVEQNNYILSYLKHRHNKSYDKGSNYNNILSIDNNKIYRKKIKLPKISNNYEINKNNNHKLKNVKSTELRLKTNNNNSHKNLSENKRNIYPKYIIDKEKINLKSLENLYNYNYISSNYYKNNIPVQKYYQKQFINLFN